MSDFLVAYMAPLMFGGLIVFMLIGYPVAFSLGAVGLFFGVIGIHMGFFSVSLLQALPELAIFGFALAWLRSRVDSVFPGMLVHCAFNSFALATVFF